MKKNILLLFTESIRIIDFEIFALLIPLIGLKLLNLNNFAIGIALFLFSVGYLVFSYFAGKLIDSFDKKTIILILYFIAFLSLGSFFLILNNFELTKWSYYLFVFIIGIIVVFMETAITAWIPDIYDYDQISNGAGILQSSKSISNLIAPAVAGVIITFFGYNFTVLFLGIALLINIVLIGSLKNNIQSEKKEKIYSRAKEKMHFLSTLKYVFRNVYLRSIILTTATINLAFSIYGSLIIIYLITDFQLTEYTIGMILSFTGLGALLGAILAPYLIKKFNPYIVMIFGPIIPSFGLLLLSIPKNNFSIVIITLAILLGLLSRSIGSVARLTVQTIIIPSDTRAAMNGTLMMLTWGMIPIGTLIGSYVSDILGNQTLILLAGIILAFSNFYMLYLWTRYTKETQLKKLNEV